MGEGLMMAFTLARAGVGDAVIGIMLTIFLVILAVCLLPMIFFLLSMQKALTLSGPYRKMSPGLVWLNFVPLLGIVWMFVTVINVSSSIAAKGAAERRNWGNGGQTLGILYLVFGFLAWIPLLGILFGLAALVLWIVYWCKIAGYNRLMSGSQSEQERMGGMPQSPAGMGAVPAATPAAPAAAPLQPEPLQPEPANQVKCPSCGQAYTITQPGNYSCKQCGAKFKVGE